ncbi:unnamed protein product [Prorocentrum cordatum]|uniref:Uncharacterized protein n=1 Tax=Prorocentrum cordatum TaxID=2364126 RepID=A0ABN9QQX6_9DINO|nr:unnamed protein product [Polarella glacialis]
MTERMLAECRSLGPTAQCIKFLGLTTSSEIVADTSIHGKKACFLEGDALHKAMTKGIADTYVVNFHDLPVSSATGYQATSIKGTTAAQVTAKAVHLAFISTNALTRMPPETLRDWRAIRQVARCSKPACVPHVAKEGRCASK